MFETHDSTELQIPPDLSDPGNHVWSCVNLRLHMMWFHAVYSIECEDGLVFQHITFLLDPDQLIELSHCQGRNIVEVTLVTPGHVNGMGRWMMDLLSEIWDADEPGICGGQRALVYVLKDGKRYVDSPLNTSECDLINPQLLFEV